MVLKLDQSLYDSYRQYKKEEKNLIDWFVRTSQKCSGTIYFNKGKPLAKSTGSVLIYDILPMAQVIARHPSVERIPNDIANSLRSVTYRDNTKQGDTETQRLNRTHEYPLAVLRKTAELLKEKLPSNSTPAFARLKSNVLELTPLVFTNYFADLQIGECVDISDNQISQSASPENRSLPSSKSSLHLETRKRNALMNEVMMLRYCLLEDMEALEAMVVQEWMSFLTDSQSLLGASIIANHAISLVVQLESDAYRALNMNKDEIESNTHDPLTCIELHGLADCLKCDEQGQFTQPVIRMQNILSDLWSRPKDFANSSKLYHNIEDLDYFTASNTDQTLYEIAILSRVKAVHEPCVTSDDHKDPEAQSIRLLRWLQCHPDKWRTPECIPLSIAFAARIEVLTHHICRNHIGREKRKSTKWYNEAINSLHEYLKLVDSKLSLVDYFQSNAREFWVPHTNIIIESMEADLIRSAPAEELAFRISTSAMNQMSVRDRYIYVMIESIMELHTFKLLAHLHDMCKSEDPEMENWPDLDFLEQYHEALMYKGSKPSKGPKERYGNRMEYECGLTTQIRSTAKGRVLSKRRVLRKNAYIDASSHMFPITTLTAFRAGTDTIYDGATEQINLLLRTRIVPELIGETPKNFRLDLDCDKFVIRDHAELAKFAAKGAQLRPTQVLALVRHGLRGELQHSEFDFVEFYKGCLHLASLLGHHWQTNNIHKDLKNGRLYSAHDIAATVASDVGTSIQSAVTCSSFCLCCKAGAQPKVAAVTEIFNKWVKKKGDVGLQRVQRHVLKPKHIKTLPLSFQSKLKEIHTKYGTMDDLFTPEQRRGIEWLDQTIVLEDMMQSDFGKRARKNRNAL